MEHYAGIDVSLELSSVCVVDDSHKRPGKRDAFPASSPVKLRLTWVRLEEEICQLWFLLPVVLRSLSKTIAQSTAKPPSAIINCGR